MKREATGRVEAASQQTLPPSTRVLRWLRRQTRRQPLGAAGAAILLLLFVLAAAAPLIATHDPVGINPMATLVAPSANNLLGTDHLGRDIFSRLVYGSRVSLMVGFGAAFLACLAALVVGVSSAYFGGKVDLVLQRAVDILMVFPTLILAIVVTTVIGSGLANVILAIAVSQAPRLSRIFRSAALTVRETTYIEAARAVGCRDGRIIVRHIVPNIMAPFLIMLTATLGVAILVEASLSFLGLGVPEPYPSWGRMLSGAATYAEVAPWLVLAPGSAITLVVLAFNLFGDSLRDILDPRLRRG